MTFLYFLNCLSLTFGPLVLSYRSTALSDLNGYPSLVSIFFYYCLLQIVKLFILAQLPSTFSDAQYSFFVEISRILLQVFVDSFGIAYCIKNARFINKMTSSNLRIFCVALGWSFAHSITHYLVPLWSAMKIEFGWIYAFMAIRSNIHFLNCVALTALIYQDTRKASNKNEENDKKIKKRKNKSQKNDETGTAVWYKSSSYVMSFKSYAIIAISTSIASLTGFCEKVLMISAGTCLFAEICLTIPFVCFVYALVGNKVLKID